MLKKALLIVCSTLLFACGNPDKVAIPGSVLSEEQMAKVLLDIHLVEATMNLNVAEAGRTKPSNLDVFSKHNTTKQQYDESYLFYTKNPELLAEVYELVLNDLSRMQAEAANAK